MLKKYISSGKRLILKVLLKNSRIFSTYIENKIPNIIPNKVAKELQDEIKKRKLENSVSVVGQQNRRDALNIIENSDIGVLINEKGNKHSELYTSPLKYYEYLRGKLKVIAVDFPSHRSLMFSDKIIFFNLESRESLINALELSIKNETSFLEEDEIRKLSLEARATSIINFCFFQ